MKAIILAAGEGSRMRSTIPASYPKPLLKLLGLRIIERVILAAKRAGIKEFIVVTGYQGEDIKRCLDGGRRLGVDIQYAFNQQWYKGNAHSLLVAKQFLKPGERFFLLMGDHIFEDTLLCALLEHIASRMAGSQDSDDLHFLAVDVSPQKELDVNEATKVFSADGKITALGKGLKQFNGIDAGIFNFDYSIFSALEENIEDSDGSLSSALQPIIKRGRLEAFPFQGYFWQDIDICRDLRIAKHKLLKSLISEKDGVVSRYFNRRLSLAITSQLSRFSINPNAISLASFSFCLLSASLFVLGLPLAGGLIAQLASIVDGVDGEIARLKFQDSPFGAYLDSILDRYADAALIGGIVAGIILTGSTPLLPVLLTGFLALTASPLSMLAKEKYANLTGKEYNPLKLEGRLGYLPINRDGRFAVIMVGGILNQLFPALIVLAILTNLQAIMRLVLLRKHLS